MHIAEKTLLMQPLTFRGDYHQPEPEPEEKDLSPPLLTPREKTAAAEGDFDGLY